jgi:hypothetical protein
MLKDADPVRLVAGLLGLVQADQASGFELTIEPEKKTKSRFDSPRERKEGSPRPQRTYAERQATRPDSSFSKTRPDGSFKPRSDFEDKPRPYAKPRPDAADKPRKTWEDRAAKPEVKDTPRPWKPSAKPAGKPAPKFGEGPAKPWKKK